MKTPISPDQKTVFVITNLGEDGLRHLSAPANQSRYHYATQSDADLLRNLLRNMLRNQKTLSLFKERKTVLMYLLT